MAARGRRGGPSLRSQDGGGENQGVEHHVQGDGAPDGAAVVVAPGQGQGLFPFSATASLLPGHEA